MNKPDMVYYKSILVKHLRTCHPQLADDNEFIKDKLQEAESLYTELTNEGKFMESTVYDLFIKVLFDI